MVIIVRLCAGLWSVFLKALCEGLVSLFVQEEVLSHLKGCSRYFKTTLHFSSCAYCFCTFEKQCCRALVIISRLCTFERLIIILTAFFANLTGCNDYSKKTRQI